MRLYNDKGQLIGRVFDDALHKTVHGSEHFLQVPPAIAVDVKAVHQAQNAGAHIVEVLDAETKIIYSTTIAILWKHGIHINRGHSPQIALPFKWWAQLNPAQIQMFEEV